MKKIRVALLIAAGLCLLPSWGFAQEEDETEANQAAEENDEAAADDTEDEDEDDDASDISAICPTCKKFDPEAEAARDIKEQVWAVQQLFVMRRGRVELLPFYSFSLNDQYVSHNAPGLGINYWITNALAVGLTGQYYAPFNQDSAFNFDTRKSARVSVPLTEYNWRAALDVYYSPLLGKLSGFGDFIFQYDAYVVGGVGAMSSRPTPVVDPDYRTFDWSTSLAFNAGIGFHIFFTRWLALNLEVRDIMFVEKIENTELAATEQERKDPSTWYGDSQFTHNFQAQVGLSIFVPFAFEYRLAK